jgi:hypothetical protein
MAELDREWRELGEFIYSAIHVAGHICRETRLGWP